MAAAGARRVRPESLPGVELAAEVFYQPSCKPEAPVEGDNSFLDSLKAVLAAVIEGDWHACDDGLSDRLRRLNDLSNLLLGAHVSTLSRLSTRVKAAQAASGISRALARVWASLASIVRSA